MSKHPRPNPSSLGSATQNLCHAVTPFIGTPKPTPSRLARPQGLPFWSIPNAVMDPTTGQTYPYGYKRLSDDDQTILQDLMDLVALMGIYPHRHRNEVWHPAASYAPSCQIGPFLSFFFPSTILRTSTHRRYILTYGLFLSLGVDFLLQL